jgi:predicted transcriptional regulator
MAGIGDQIKSANKSVSKWAKKTTSAVSEWWDEVNAVNERRSEIRDLAREREKLLVEMGTKVYTLHRRGKVQNRDLLNDCERIDDIAETIERLEEEIAELKRQKAQARPREVKVSDESGVVGEEDVEASAAEPSADEPEVEKEATPEDAHTQDAAEGPAEDVEGEEGPTMAPVSPPEDTPETDKEAAMPEAHSQDSTEGPAGEAGAADTSKTEAEAPEPDFERVPAGDASEPEVESEDAAPCAHAQAAAEGPADEEESDAKPGCDE